ncbi:hypothetical protein ACFL1S_02295 [Pseudomonadota bacterium]
MKYLRSLFSPRSPDIEPAGSYSTLVVDLTQYRCGHSQLGYPPSEADFFARSLNEKEIFEDTTHGFEVGVQDGKLNYILIALEKYPGIFKQRGKVVELNTTTTIDDVQKRFGEPYWLDDDTDEILFFYEDGGVEMQFEFPGKKSLGFITILLDPLMADPEQREAYGVTKPWPPR